MKTNERCPKWTPVAERLPRPGSMVLCRFKLPQTSSVVVGVCKLVGNEFMSEWMFGPWSVGVSEWCDIASQLAAETARADKAEAERDLLFSQLPMKDTPTIGMDMVSRWVDDKRRADAAESARDDAVRERDEYGKYASYCRSCALSGEWNPDTFSVFKQRLLQPQEVSDGGEGVCQS